MPPKLLATAGRCWPSGSKCEQCSTIAAPPGRTAWPHRLAVSVLRILRAHSRVQELRSSELEATEADLYGVLGDARGKLWASM